jgi:hypothetical protein
MDKHKDSTAAADAAPTVAGSLVSIFVPDTHPLLLLKAALDWQAITAVMVEHWRKAGKNVAAGRGLSWPVQLYVPLLVLMWLESLNDRQMEKYLSESVVARRFLDLDAEQRMQIRDHSSIARAEAALGAAGKEAVNALIVQTAQALGFTNGAVLSSDTTVQEPQIGYPNEPGILKGWAERLARSFKRLTERGVAGAAAGLEKTKEIIRQVKQHHLWAKTKEEKKKLLAKMLESSRELLRHAQEVIEQISGRCGQAKQKAAGKIKELVDVGRRLLPQIKHWLETGKVAAGKIIHVGLKQARALVKGGGRVKFGFKWRINRLKGGYVFGRRVAAQADENKQPKEALKDYRKVFGQAATPQMVVYDRGASATAAAPELYKQGVEQVGIPPRGQGAWLVGEAEQQIVKSERGKTEGSIGRLKSQKYGFSGRQHRSLQTQEAVGQRAIVSVNLNTLLRDLVKQEQAANPAQG